MMLSDRSFPVPQSSISDMSLRSMDEGLVKDLSAFAKALGAAKTRAQRNRLEKIH